MEFQTAHTYDYFVINDTVDEAVRELDAIMTAEHCKPKERMEIIGGITREARAKNAIKQPHSGRIGSGLL